MIFSSILHLIFCSNLSFRRIKVCFVPIPDDFLFFSKLIHCNSQMNINRTSILKVVEMLFYKNFLRFVIHSFNLSQKVTVISNDQSVLNIFAQFYIIKSTICTNQLSKHQISGNLLPIFEVVCSSYTISIICYNFYEFFLSIRVRILFYLDLYLLTILTSNFLFNCFPNLCTILSCKNSTLLVSLTISYTKR